MTDKELLLRISELLDKKYIYYEIFPLQFRPKGTKIEYI